MNTPKISPMAILMAALILALIMSLPTYAQTPRPNTDQHVAALKERLNLSDEQTAQVRAILEEHQKIADTEREQYRGNREEALKAAKARLQATDEKIKAVLNDEQKKEYDKVKDEIRKEFRKNRGGGRRGR